MALRTSFGTIIQMTRMEARRSTNSSVGIDNLDNIKQIIKRHYALLASSYDWRHLQIKRSDAGKNLQASSRYYDFPTTLNTDDRFEIWSFQMGVWTPLEHGITPEHYNVYDSDSGVVASPVTRWDWYDYGQFEVWPMPSENLTNGLRFTGHRKINPLTDENQAADIDDILLSLQSAATLLYDSGQKQAAEERVSAANARLRQMKVGKSDNTRAIMGGGRDPAMGPRGDTPGHTEYVRR